MWCTQEFSSHWLMLSAFLLQVDRLDVDSLFSNMESVHQISAKLLSLLEEATTDVEPAMQVIGVFVLSFSSTIQQEMVL